MRSSLLILRAQPDFVARVHFGQGLELYRWAGAEVSRSLSEYVRCGTAALDCAWLGRPVTPGSEDSHIIGFMSDAVEQGGPYPFPEGESVRAVQIILGRRGGEFRFNHSIRGTLEIALSQTGNETIRFAPSFRCHDDEDPEASHFTAIQWPDLTPPRVILNWNVVPSVVRRASDSMLGESFGLRLPNGARQRWRGLMRQGNASLVKGALWESRFVIPEKFRLAVLESIERSARAGLPSRRSGIQLEPLDEVVASSAEDSLAAPDGPGNDARLDLAKVARGLPKRTLEILEAICAGYTEAEVAQRLGISQQAVNKTKSKALALLRRRLGGNSG